MQRKEPRRDAALHGSGMGMATEEEIERRARELAELDDRPADSVNDEDRRRARVELRGQDIDTAIGSETKSTAEGPRNPADTKVQHGEEAARRKPLEDQQFMEEEIKEGVREAEHERSVRAHEELPDSNAPPGDSER